MRHFLCSGSLIVQCSGSENCKLWNSNDRWTDIHHSFINHLQIFLLLIAALQPNEISLDSSITNEGSLVSIFQFRARILYCLLVGIYSPREVRNKLLLLKPGLRWNTELWLTYCMWESLDGCGLSSTMVMHCDNQDVMYTANNSVFHESTKHIKVNCHFIRDTMMAKRIVTNYMLFSMTSWWYPH